MEVSFYVGKSIMRVVKKSEEEALVTWNLLRSF